MTTTNDVYPKHQAMQKSGWEWARSSRERERERAKRMLVKTRRLQVESASVAASVAAGGGLEPGDELVNGEALGESGAGASGRRRA